MTTSADRAPLHVLVVDDQRAFAQSLEVILEAQDEIGKVGSVGSAEEAIDYVAGERPDVVVMDVELPGASGIDATAQLVSDHPDMTVVILTGIPDVTVFFRAASAGAHAFLLKDSSLDEILDAVLHTSPHGHIDVDSATVREIAEAAFGGSGDLAEQLTRREFEVLGLLSEGRQPKEIARSLGISVHTCRDHVKSLLVKLDAHSALEAVVVAIRRGLISLPPR